MFDPARVTRIRRGVEEEPDAVSARYLVEELRKCYVKDPGAERHETRYDELIGALAEICERNGTSWRPPYKSLRAWTRQTKADGQPPLLLQVKAKNLFDPLLDELDGVGTLIEAVDEEEAPGWGKLEGAIQELREHYALAKTTTDYGNLARECREVLVLVAELAYDSDRHEIETDEDESRVTPRLKAVIAKEAAGGDEAERRKLLKAVMDYANKLQHRQTITRRDAADLCDATIVAARMVERITQDD